MHKCMHCIPSILIGENRQPLSSVVGWPSVLAFRARPCGDLQQGGGSHTAVAATPAPTDCHMQVRLDRPKDVVPKGFVDVQLTLDEGMINFQRLCRMKYP